MERSFLVGHNSFVASSASPVQLSLRLHEVRTGEKLAEEKQDCKSDELLNVATNEMAAPGRAAISIQCCAFVTFLLVIDDSLHTAIDRWAFSPMYRSSAHEYP